MRGQRQRRRQVQDLASRLRHPARRVAEVRQAARQARSRLDREIGQKIALARTRVHALSDRLRALSPLAVLDRGYAVIRTERGLLTDAADVSDGDALQIRLARGKIAAQVVGAAQDLTDA